VGSPSRRVPVKVVAEATIMDINNQALVTSKEMTLHPSQIYIGNAECYQNLICSRNETSEKFCVTKGAVSD
jgi:hypothetical protein